MAVKDKFKNLLGKRTPVSSSAIKPGDALVFKYYYIDQNKRSISHERLVLVVSNKRSSSGVFIGSRNKLLSAFNLGLKQEGTIRMILDQLYRNRKASSYNKINENQISGLKALLGDSSYRTFKLSGIKDLHKVKIK